MALMAQPLQVIHVIRTTLCNGYDVITFAQLGRPGTVLARIQVTALDGLYLAPPGPATSALSVHLRLPRYDAATLFWLQFLFHTVIGILLHQVHDKLKGISDPL